VDVGIAEVAEELFEVVLVRVWVSVETQKVD
jgi:hypothetical protein